MDRKQADCPLCGSAGHRVLRRYAAHHLVRCDRCQFVYTSLRPSEEELLKAYASYPVHEELSPVTALRYDELLDRFEPYRKHNRLLDVGCGAGLFLERAAQRGWEVQGTEYGELAVNACRERGIKIDQGPLDPNAYPEGHFDVVCSFEVIEHVVRPIEELRHMRQVLRLGGLMYITTPNFDCVGRWMGRGKWNVVHYPEHLSYFTARTLRDAAKRVDLEEKWLETTGFSVGRWRSSLTKDPEKKMAVRGSDETLRRRIEDDRLLRFGKRTINALLDLFKIGDSMKGAWEKHVQ
ncbi:MAG: class I SAM-dependent methyltransferase [Flavobacteriales bacterium]|nr:class I SAM-dependent methyltransferase [Flavobacteriales bacterium]